jgi:hypothetical protein
VKHEKLRVAWPCGAQTVKGGKVKRIALLAVLGSCLVPAVAQAGTTTSRLLAQTHAAIPATQLPHPVSAREGLYTSSNWSGFADLSKNRTHFTHVSSSFRVPSVDCAQSDGGTEGNWVGIDGFSSRSVEQTGTLSDCSSGYPAYYAFYEMYPLAPEVYTGVSPGDRINVSVQYHLGEYTLDLTDVTTGGYIHTRHACPVRCVRTSAEVIVERPSTSSGPVPLADFGSTSFSSTHVAASPTTGDLDAKSGRWSSAKIYMKTDGTTLAAPSVLSGGGSAFGVTWKNATACPPNCQGY